VEIPALYMERTHWELSGFGLSSSNCSHWCPLLEGVYLSISLTGTRSHRLYGIAVKHAGLVPDAVGFWDCGRGTSFDLFSVGWHALGRYTIY